MTDEGTTIRIWNDSNLLALLPKRIVFDMTNGVVKILCEHKYYIMGFKDINRMSYSSARNSWYFDINCPLPIGEIDV